MILFIMLLLILSISFGIKLMLNIKQEEAIFLSLFGIGIITYILGLIDLLWISPYILILLSIFSFIFTIIKLIKKQEKVQNLITLPTIIYILISCIIYYIVKDLHYENYDEYMFWGINLKEMIRNSCLWANSKIDGIHLIYPPFTAVIQYIFCVLGNGFNEGISYFGLILLIFTTMMPVLKNETFSIKSFFKIIFIFVITYISIVFFQYDIANLSVDCILGVALAVSMYLAYDIKEKKDYIVLGIMLSAITLMKTNGILLAGIVIMQIFFIKIFELIKEKEKNIKKILDKLSIVLILLVIIMFNFGIWKIYCTINGKQVDERHDMNSVNNINIVEFINAVFQNDMAKNRNKKMAVNFMNNIINLKVTQNKYCNSTIWCIFIINILNIIYILFKKQKLRLINNCISINIGFILYATTTLIVFMFVFQPDQGEMLMGFERYIQTYLLAMTLNLIYIIFQNVNLKSIILICFITIYMTLPLNKSIIDPRENRFIIEEKVKDNVYTIINNVEEDKKVYIIDQKVNGGTEFMKTRYLISPRQTNLLYEWNIGYSTSNIFYRMVITEKLFFRKLIDENYDYVYIIDIENNFLEQYKNILSDNAYNELNKKINENRNDYYENSTPGILLKVDKINNYLDIK